MTKITQNVPPSSYLNQQPMMNQKSSTQVNKQQSMSLSGRILARKPDFYDGNTGIDEWMDSMKAYVEGTNPGVVMDKVRVKIKLYMGPNALRGVKHALKEEFCDWNVLKKCLETVFDRHLKYSTEMAAIQPISDANNEH